MLFISYTPQNRFTQEHMETEWKEFGKVEKQGVTFTYCLLAGQFSASSVALCL